MSGANLNPFSRRETHDAKAVWAYKILTALTWLLAVVTTLYYTFGTHSSKHHVGENIWRQNDAHRTPFHLNDIVTEIYWFVLFFIQLGYVWGLFSKNDEYVQAAASVGSHFILNNLLHFGFVVLFVKGHFWWSEVLLIINFFNLTFLYFRHNTYARFIHVPAVSGPLAWTFVALYWNGAIAVNAHSLPARIFANIAIWGILVYGAFFIAVYKDYTIGFNLSILTLSLALGQFWTKVIAFQWIFAFVIFGVLFLGTIVVALPFARKETTVTSDERAPLLDDA